MAILENGLNTHNSHIVKHAIYEQMNHLISII